MDMLSMRAPEGMESISWNGVSYTVFDGVVHVPAGASADLEAHGLVAVENIAESEEARLTALLADLDEETEMVSSALSDLAADRATAQSALDALAPPARNGKRK